MHTEIDRHVFGSINTPTGGQIMHLYLWCTDVTHRHTLTINTHRHLHTQAHLAEEDNPCKRFGRGLIWSNGGSESRFVFPALVRLRSSLPADATSCILTGSCYTTGRHPQTQHPAYLTWGCCLCASVRSTIPVRETPIKRSILKN